MMRDALAKSEVKDNDAKKTTERLSVVQQISDEIFEEVDEIDDFEDNFASVLDAKEEPIPENGEESKIGINESKPEKEESKKVETKKITYLGTPIENNPALTQLYMRASAVGTLDAF